MEFHPAANLFPMDDDTLNELAEDIRTHGLLCPVELYEGKIIDGRRRWLASRMAGIGEPAMVDVTPDDPVAYVLSLNLHRRQLTPSQRAMVAARARDMYDKLAKERQKLSKGAGVKGPVNLPDLKSDARDQAGKAVGVSGKSVDYATKVLAHGTPELIKAVDEGRMAVSTAAIHATDPPENQKQIVADPKRRRTYNSVSKPVTTGDDAMELIPAGVRGVGIEKAHEAIACLKKIPKRDALRNRGLQVVMDWIKHNK